MIVELYGITNPYENLTPELQTLGRKGTPTCSGSEVHLIGILAAVSIPYKERSILMRRDPFLLQRMSKVEF